VTTNSLSDSINDNAERVSSSLFSCQSAVKHWLKVGASGGIRGKAPQPGSGAEPWQEKAEIL